MRRPWLCACRGGTTEFGKRTGRRRGLWWFLQQFASPAEKKTAERGGNRGVGAKERQAPARSADRLAEGRGRSAAWTGASRGKSPGAGQRARPPVRHKLYCEAPTGVADPITTWPSGEVASTQEGGQRWFPANSSTQQSSTVRTPLGGRRGSAQGPIGAVPVGPSVRLVKGGGDTHRPSLCQVGIDSALRHAGGGPQQRGGL